MMGETSLETSPKNSMIQDMINSDNMCTCVLRKNLDFINIGAEKYPDYQGAPKAREKNCPVISVSGSVITEYR